MKKKTQAIMRSYLDYMYINVRILNRMEKLEINDKETHSC